MSTTLYTYKKTAALGIIDEEVSSDAVALVAATAEQWFVLDIKDSEYEQVHMRLVRFGYVPAAAPPNHEGDLRPVELGPWDPPNTETALDLAALREQLGLVVARLVELETCLAARGVTDGS